MRSITRGNMLLGMLTSFGLNVGDGLSRQALLSQVALFGLGAALWRSAVGLRVRRRQREALRARFGHDEMVELGADLASMAGGVFSVSGNALGNGRTSDIGPGEAGAVALCDIINIHRANRTVRFGLVWFFGLHLTRKFQAS